MNTLNKVVKQIQNPVVLDSSVSYLVKHPEDVITWAIEDTVKGGLSTARRTVRLTGNRYLLRGASGMYQIQDYDFRKNYEVSVSAGSVVRVDQTIEVTAPDAGSEMQLYVNGERSRILLESTVIQIPLILSPKEREYQVVLPVSLSISSYAV